MAIATASLDFEGLAQTPKLASVTSELAALQGFPFLREAPNLGALAGASRLRTVSRGTIVASEGTTPGQAILVVKGRLRAVRRASSGREITVEVFRAGELLADGALAPDAPLVNDWDAAEESTLLMIPRDALIAFLAGAPQVTLSLGAQLVSRLERSKELAVGLALSDVESRVVGTLVGLGRQEGARAESAEGMLIRLRPTQQELANQIGACRETVSRTVSDLVRRGLLTPRGRSLLISPRLYAGTATSSPQ